MIPKKIYLDHYDIDGDPMNVITCENCGHQERKEDGKLLYLYDRDVKCCENPLYFYGIVIPENDSDKEVE